MTATLCNWIMNVLIHRLQTFWTCNHLLHPSAQHRSTPWLCTQSLPFSAFLLCWEVCWDFISGGNPQSCVGGSQRTNCSTSAKWKEAWGGKNPVPSCCYLIQRSNRKHPVRMHYKLTNGMCEEGFAAKLIKSGEWHRSFHCRSTRLQRSFFLRLLNSSRTHRHQ